MDYGTHTINNIEPFIILAVMGIMVFFIIYTMIPDSEKSNS